MYFFNLSCFFDFFDFQFSFVEWSQVFTVCVFSLAPQHFENLHSKVVICTEQKTFIARVWFAQSSHRNVALPNRLCRFVFQFLCFAVCVFFCLRVVVFLAALLVFSVMISKIIMTSSWKDFLMTFWVHLWETAFSGYDVAALLWTAFLMHVLYRSVYWRLLPTRLFLDLCGFFAPKNNPCHLELQKKTANLLLSSKKQTANIILSSKKQPLSSWVSKTTKNQKTQQISSWAPKNKQQISSCAPKNNPWHLELQKKTANLLLSFKKTDSQCHLVLQKTTHVILSSKKKQQISSRAPKPQHFQVIFVFLGFLGFKFRAWGLGFEFWAWGLGFWVLSLRLRCSIWIFYDPVRFLRFLGFEFRAWGLGFGFWAWGLGFWVLSLRFEALNTTPQP